MIDWSANSSGIVGPTNPPPVKSLDAATIRHPGARFAKFADCNVGVAADQHAARADVRVTADGKPAGDIREIVDDAVVADPNAVRLADSDGFPDDRVPAKRARVRKVEKDVVVLPAHDPYLAYYNRSRNAQAPAAYWLGGGLNGILFMTSCIRLFRSCGPAVAIPDHSRISLLKSSPSSGREHEAIIAFAGGSSRCRSTGGPMTTFRQAMEWRRAPGDYAVVRLAPGSHGDADVGRVAVVAHFAGGLEPAREQGAPCHGKSSGKVAK